ncbi:MAG: hypothetical protein SGILL_005410, partial [Bacillariaceae sp.]
MSSLLNKAIEILCADSVDVYGDGLYRGDLYGGDLYGDDGIGIYGIQSDENVPAFVVDLDMPTLVTGAVAIMMCCVVIAAVMAAIVQLYRCCKHFYKLIKNKPLVKAEDNDVVCTGVFLTTASILDAATEYDIVLDGHASATMEFVKAEDHDGDMMVCGQVEWALVPLLAADKIGEIGLEEVDFDNYVQGNQLRTSELAHKIDEDFPEGYCSDYALFTNGAGRVSLIKGQNLVPPTKPRKQTKVTFHSTAVVNIIPNYHDPFMAGNHGRGMYNTDQNYAEVDQEERLMGGWKDEFTANVVPLLAPVEEEEIPEPIEEFPAVLEEPEEIPEQVEDEEFPVVLEEPEEIPDPLEDEEFPAEFEEPEEIPDPIPEPPVVVPVVPLRRSARIAERQKKLEGLVLVK